MEILGLVICIVGALCVGSMSPLATKIGGTPLQKTCGISVASLLVGTVIFAIEMGLGFTYLTWGGMVVFIVSMLNGLFMFLGLTFLFKSIKIADVAKAVPINNIGQFLSATLVSAFFFGNWLGDNAGVKILYGFIFIAIILVGIILISIYPGGKSEVLPAGMVEAITVQTKTKNTINSKFFLYEFISIGSLFMLFFTPELIANFNNETSWLFLNNPNLVIPNTDKFMDGFDLGMSFPMGIGFFLSSFVALFIHSKKVHVSYFVIFKDKKIWRNILPGMLQAIWNVALIVSVSMIGGSIASPLSQISTASAMLLGIFYLKEKREKPYLCTTLIGCGLILLGVFMATIMNFELHL